jgi:hypothetical protein
MPLQSRVSRFLLWWAVLAWSLWVGGTVFHMLVVVPLWSSSPPESVTAFFRGTDFNRTIGNFFGPPWMAVRMAPLIGALLVGWRSRPHRVPLLVASASMLFGLVYTLAYIYPINSVLMAQAGGSGSPDEIRAMVQRWILADRLRFVVGTVGFLALLKAFSLPADLEAA